MQREDITFPDWRGELKMKNDTKIGVPTMQNNTKRGETPMKNEAQKTELLDGSSHDMVIRDIIYTCICKVSVIENQFETMANDFRSKNCDLLYGYKIICNELSEKLETVYGAHHGISLT